MDTTTAQLAINDASLLLFASLMLFGGAYLHYRGAKGKSPLPDVVEQLVNPQPKPPKPTPPTPPQLKCPRCRKGPKWTANDDLSAWTCQVDGCGEIIPGPNAKIRA